MFISDWWNSLSIVSQVFACIAIPSTLVLLIQTIMMFVGMEGDGDVDVDSGDISEVVPDDIGDADVGDGVFGEDISGEPLDLSGLQGLRIFTVRGIIAFFVVLGWVGMVLDSAGVGLGITLPVAILCGSIMMIVLALLFRAVMNLRSDGNTDNRNAIGCSGKVYLTIPPSRTGEGKVSVMLQGSYVERDAVTDADEAIPTGSEIVVVGISGQTDLVVRKK
ncbi:MAG: hypothetical protein E7679_03735 [Ruminococcaceae bacterium]|nr:hypothetical protein [Oscillospiraceae bacterium]